VFPLHTDSEEDEVNVEDDLALEGEHSDSEVHFNSGMYPPL
jgi:hypothetical protein